MVTGETHLTERKVEGLCWEIPDNVSVNNMGSRK